MHSFADLSARFEKDFSRRHFPQSPATLYDASQYILQLGGKRVRPVCVLMACELFDEINEEAFDVATAVELFHNFTLIHDDIMDRAPLRRGMETVHTRFGSSTALLAGDVMLVVAYEYLSRVDPVKLKHLLAIFNRTAREVCEGQQLDMDFEMRETVHLDEYIEMITLKTSVLLAASLQMGAVTGGAGEMNQQHLYAFGKNLGIAFQVQDDYLDAFGDPSRFGKQPGGDIRANKKTFLLIHALEHSSAADRAELQELLSGDAPDKVDRVLRIFRSCGADTWANALKEEYYMKALGHLEALAVQRSRKTEMEHLARYLLQRDS